MEEYISNPITPKVTNNVNDSTGYYQHVQMSETDVKTYSLARKIFEGIGLILANILTFGLINIIFSKTIREEYERVFCNKAITQVVVNDDDSNGVDDLVIPDQKKTSSELLEKIFPKDAHSKAETTIKIPKKVQNSLVEIFGIKDVVSKMPVCEKTVDDFFTVEDIPYPVMKAKDKFGFPFVFVKLKVANPEEYNKHYSLIADNKAKTHLIILGQIYKNKPPLMWGSWEQSRREPSFFCQELRYYDDQITYEDGAVIDSLKDKIPEFQKLFTVEGVGTDVYGNRWKLALD